MSAIEQKRQKNERKFGQWEALPDNGRRYSYTIDGRYGWTARYVKEIDASENTMIVTRRQVAQKLTDYLRNQLSLEELIDWAEQVMLDGDFAPEDYALLRDIVGRIGLADARLWPDMGGLSGLFIPVGLQNASYSLGNGLIFLVI